jgi:hypothetical protein
MESQYRDTLVAILAGYLNQKAIKYLQDYHYDKMTYTDNSNKEFRQADELSSVYSGVESDSLALSKEIIEEAEANGLDINKDEGEIAELLTKTLKDETIIQRLYDKADNLVNELP